ncbi:hypothetical protein CYMTET_16340, partial [Cymbomonas tetramitiformis]
GTFFQSMKAALHEMAYSVTQNVRLHNFSMTPSNTTLDPSHITFNAKLLFPQGFGTHARYLQDSMQGEDPLNLLSNSTRRQYKITKMEFRELVERASPPPEHEYRRESYAPPPGIAAEDDSGSGYLSPVMGFAALACLLRRAFL